MSEPAYALGLCEDTLPTGRRGALPPANRVLYVRAGAVVVSAGGRETLRQRAPQRASW